MFAASLCPRCPDHRLEKTRLQSAAILGCARCEGAFLSGDRGLTVLAMLAAEPVSDLGPQVSCPVCRCPAKTIQTPNYPIRAHACARHGVWLDKDDLFLLPRAIVKTSGKSLRTLTTEDEQVRATATTTSKVPAAIRGETVRDKGPAEHFTEDVAEAALEEGVTSTLADEALGDGVLDLFGWLEGLG